MIVKETEEIYAFDKYAQAGFAAEKQMAFYLKRGFGEDPKVLVLNGLRIVQGNDAAQIDHLLLHEYGMIIIESKQPAMTRRRPGPLLSRSVVQGLTQHKVDLIIR